MKCAMHPTSHSWPMYSSEPEANHLKMCALISSLGMLGFFRLQVCENFMVALVGRIICM